MRKARYQSTVDRFYDMLKNVDRREFVSSDEAADWASICREAYKKATDEDVKNYLKYIVEVELDSVL